MILNNQDLKIKFPGYGFYLSPTGNNAYTLYFAKLNSNNTINVFNDYTSFCIGTDGNHSCIYLQERMFSLEYTGQTLAPLEHRVFEALTIQFLTRRIRWFMIFCLILYFLILTTGKLLITQHLQQVSVNVNPLSILDDAKAQEPPPTPGLYRLSVESNGQTYTYDLRVQSIDGNSWVCNEKSIYMWKTVEYLDITDGYGQLLMRLEDYELYKISDNITTSQNSVSANKLPVS